MLKGKGKVGKNEKPQAGNVAKCDCWRYGPNGEAVLLKEGDPIPDGYKDTPAAFVKKDDNDSK